MLFYMTALFDTCLAGKHRSKKTITPTDVMRLIESPYYFWCARFAPSEEKDPITEYKSLLFARGREAEDTAIQKLHPDLIKISFKTFEEGFRTLLVQMEQGVPVIRNLPLFWLEEDLFGMFDLLEKKKGKSNFGEYHYVVKDIKSAKNIKEKHILPTALYNYILGKIQGHTPEEFYLINRDLEEFAFRFEDYEERLQEILGEIKEILDGKEVRPLAKCPWPWTSYCKKQAGDVDDVSLLCSVGKEAQKKLAEENIHTIQDVMNADELPDIRPANAERIKLCAKAVTENKPVVLDKVNLPEKQVELFLDIESTDELGAQGFERFDYLYGVLVSKGEDVTFEKFVAYHLQEEEKMFRTFVGFLRELPDFVLYHYSPYERLHIATLGAKYDIDVDFIISSMVDLMKVVKKKVIFPTSGNSLKEIARYLGFDWRGETDAQQSIVLYLKYLETKDDAILQEIIQYNEDDVRATKVLKDWLATNT